MILISVLKFENGSYSWMKLGEGSIGDLTKTMNLIPAVSYSGEEKVKDSFLKIISESDFKILVDAESKV